MSCRRSPNDARPATQTVSTTRTGRTADGTAYSLTGPSEAPVVVLIHGLGLSQALWDDHLRFFRDAYLVLTYDLYGHGDSEAVPVGLQPATLGGYATQLADLLDELNIARAHIVGFSIGGMINRRFALDHPERVTSLVIMSSPHDRGSDGQREVEERAASVGQKGAMSTMDAALARWFTPGHLADHPQHEELVRAWRLAADPESYAQATWVLANGVRELIDPARQPSGPTLVLTGADDTGSTAAMSRAIADAIVPAGDGARCQIIDGYRHLGLMESPEAFADPVRGFLDELNNETENDRE